MNDLAVKRRLNIRPPSDIIKQQMEIARLSPDTLAQRMKVSLSTIDKLLRGDTPIDNDTATLLVKEFGFNFDFWIKVQQIYNEQIDNIKSRVRILQEFIKEDEEKCKGKSAVRVFNKVKKRLKNYVQSFDKEKYAHFVKKVNSFVKDETTLQSFLDDNGKIADDTQKYVKLSFILFHIYDGDETLQDIDRDLILLMKIMELKSMREELALYTKYLKYINNE